MAVMIPPVVIAVGAAIIKGIVATSKFVAAGMASVAGIIPEPVSTAVSKGVTAIVKATPPKVKELVGGTVNSLAETGKKVKEYFDKNQPNTGDSAKTMTDYGREGKEVKNKIADLQRAQEHYRKTSDSGDDIKQNRNSPSTKEGTSNTTQYDSIITKQAAFKEKLRSIKTPGENPSKDMTEENPSRPKPK